MASRLGPHWLLRVGIGLVLVAALTAIYLLNAPPLLLRWEAGAVTPAAAGWYAWPQWTSALMVAAACGLTYATALRLGVAPLWAAAAALACGLGWALWMVALVPSAKSIAMLCSSLGMLALAWWAGADASRRRSSVALLLAVVALVGGAWLQPLLPPQSTVQAPGSPGDVARALIDDLRPLATLAAALGALQLWSRSRRAALAFGALLAMYLLLPLVAGVSTHAALLPASFPLWVGVALGLEWIESVGDRHSGTTKVVPSIGAIRATFALALVLAAVLTVERALLNSTFISRAGAPFFPGSLALSLASIGPNGGVLIDGPETLRRVARMSAVLPVGPFRLVPLPSMTSALQAGETFAFQAIRGELEAQNLGARTVPRRVPLAVFLRMLPPGNVAAIAMTPFVTNAMSREAAGTFAAIGAPDTSNATLAYALVGRTGAASGALVQQEGDRARVAIAAGGQLGGAAAASPIAIDAAANRDVATIALDGREILRVPYGGALVVTTREGHLQMAYALTPEQRLQMPLPADDWSVARLTVAGQGPPRPDPLFAHQHDASALLRLDGRDRSYFTAGWHNPERLGAIDFMWTSDSRSHLVIPLARTAELRVIVELSPAVADDRDPPQVGLHVNGQAFGPHPALPGRRLYEWRVPQEAWREGANDVALELSKTTRPLGSHDQRLLGAAVSLVRLERVIR